MAKLKWDAENERYYHTGVDRCAIYVADDAGNYGKGVAWNGVTNITESPDGAEPNDFYADNILYASLRSAEKVKGSIKAYTYPDAFAECDGSREIYSGARVFAGQQKRKKFGMVYRNRIGNNDNEEFGYELHILYGLTVSPSERSHDTVNEDPELEELSWDFEGLPEKFSKRSGFKPIGSISISTRNTGTNVWDKIVETLFGTANTDPELPKPDDLYDLIDGVLNPPPQQQNGGNG